MIIESNQEVVMKALSKPFPPELVRTRIGRKSAKKDKATILFYIDARHVMQRLDDVVGIMSWQHEFKAWKKDEQLCGIAILTQQNYGQHPPEWVIKWDGADATAVEATKGGLSDSFKRAAVHWGIGRYLYDCKDTTYYDIDEWGNFTDASLKKIYRNNADSLGGTDG